MLDMFGLPPERRGHVWKSSVSGDWETWSKPSGVSMLHMICIGGGGGGGKGLAGIAGAARGGGGGGGSSAIVRVTIPAFLVPDILYILAGEGGLGSNTAGGANGSHSYISVAPNVTTMNLVAISTSAFAGGGGAGTGAAGGSGGGAGSAPSATSALFNGLGSWHTIAGQTGAPGGNPTQNGGAITIAALCQGGSGGAGVTAADLIGGAFTAVAGSYISEQRPATPAAGAFNGSGGPQLWKPFFMFGGGGGSSSNGDVGGWGGHGGFGAGGGGGGGGTSAGRGGNGGHGLVIIAAW